MIKNIIFDLSEVLIAGVLGIEKELSQLTGIDEQVIIAQIFKENFKEVLRGEISEDEYLDSILAKYNLKIEKDFLKEKIRNNFHNQVEGTIAVLENLHNKYKLYLLSDHAKEWIDYIKTVHPFFDLFEKDVYSFQIAATKHSVEAFEKFFRLTDLNPEECLFIDDHERNIINANVVGLDGIVFKSADDLINQLRLKGIEL